MAIPARAKRQTDGADDAFRAIAKRAKGGDWRGGQSQSRSKPKTPQNADLGRFGDLGLHRLKSILQRTHNGLLVLIADAQIRTGRDLPKARASAVLMHGGIDAV